MLKHLGKPLRFKVTIGEVGRAQAASAAAAPPAHRKTMCRARALANPEVQRFRELFGGEVRTVRNLKE